MKTKKRDPKSVEKQKTNWNRFFITLLIAIAIVSFWRGIWGLMDLYLFPHMLPLSFTLSIFFGLIILYAVKHSWKLIK